MVRNPPANPEDMGLILGSGRSPGEGNGNPLFSILAWEMPWTDGALWATVDGVAKDLAVT